MDKIDFMVISEQNLIFLLSGVAFGALLALLVSRMYAGRKQAVAEITISQLSQELSTARATLISRDNDLASLNRDKASLETRLEVDRTRYDEQLQLLKQARENLTF